MLLGITGRNAAGKTTIVEILVERGWTGCSCSDAIRSWLRDNGQEINRENLTQGGRTLRSEGGPGILAERLLNQIDPMIPTVIDSIRTPDEVKALRSRDSFRLIEVVASTDLRWKRMQIRGRSGDPTNYASFLAQEDAEAVAENSAGQALDATAALADILIVNDSGMDNLNNAIDEIIESLGLI